MSTVFQRAVRVWALAIACVSAAAPARAADARGEFWSSTAAGRWEGYIDRSVLAQLELVNEDGEWAGTVTVPVVPQPFTVARVRVSPGFLGPTNVETTLSCAAWGDCKLDVQVRGNAMTGFIWIHGRLYNVDLSRTPPAAPAEAPVPWAPDQPAPYSTEEVEFRSGRVRLAGELTVPEGPGPHPAVVLLSGGGADDRDGNSFVGQGDVFYRAIADRLSQRGVAVLRTDDRGVGGSEGEYEQTTLDALAGDAAAAAEYIADRPDVRKDRVGLMGFSQGAVVAPLASRRTRTCSFLVLLAPAAVVGAAGEIERAKRKVRDAEGDEFLLDGLREQLELRRRIFAPLLEGIDPPAIRRRLLAAGEFDPRTIDAVLDVLTTPRKASAFRHDAGATLSQVTVPVLAVYFGRDTIVPLDANKPALRAALAKGGNKEVTVKVFERLDHQMCEPEPEGVDRLPRPPLLPAADVLGFVGRWVEEMSSEARRG